jgi:hypothetical protein
MRSLDAPFLEIGFYFAELSDADAYVKLARAILARGSSFVASRGVHGPGARSARFRWSSELDHVPLALRTDQLPQALEDPDLRVTQLFFDHIVGVSKAPERLEYAELYSDEAALSDNHPISIIAEGEYFSGPYDRDRAIKPGKKTYNTFRELVIALEPSYACIAVEKATECPTDLHRDPRGFDDNFYMSEAFIGPSGIAAIAKLFEGAYQEPMGAGLFVSTYEYWNPRRISFDSAKASYLATEVGKLIARKRPIRA